jgi:hypothetical protein
VDGTGAAHIGFVFNAGGSLTINHCVVRNFRTAGLAIQPAAGITKIQIGQTLISDNGNGMLIQPQGSAAIQGILDHVSAENNAQAGIGVIGTAGGALTKMTSIESSATNNGTGFGSLISVLRLARSSATENGKGVDVGGAVPSKPSATTISGAMAPIFLASHRLLSPLGENRCLTRGAVAYAFASWNANAC